MLKLLFAWFDSHPQSFWVIAGLPTLILLGLVAFALIHAAKDGLSKKRELLFVLLVPAVLLAWRWPYLLSADEYNPDESQLIAGAITLFGDPVPWRSVDGTTSGPLNFYVLLPIALLGLPLDYFTARLAGLLLISVALLACYYLFRSRFGLVAASLGLLPGLAFFCTVRDSNLVHYSSEHVSIFLTALSAACLFRARQLSAQRWDQAGCFFAGTLPWAKLQSVPLALALLMIALLKVVTDKTLSRAAKPRAAALRLSFGALPSVVIVGVVSAFGQFDNFLRTYVLQNVTYVSQGESSPALALWRAGMADGQFPILLGTALVGVVTALVIFGASRFATWISWGTALLVIAAAVSIVAPRRVFLHYLLLAVIPLTIVWGQAMGVLLQNAGQRRQFWFGWIAIGIGGLVPFGFRATQSAPEIFGSFSSHWSEPRTMIANLIRRYSYPGAKLAIWGWLPTLHVQTGLPQGTRDGNTYWAITPSSQREYFRERFLSDMMGNKPALFVDAIGGESFLFSNRAADGHEAFPPLANYIQDNYRLIVDTGSARLYAQKDLKPEVDVDDSPSHPESPTEPSHVIEHLPVEKMSPADLPRWRMRAGFVQMMHPPAEIIWSLDETTREVIVDYGIAAEAYRQPRTDGAELIFELHAAGAPVRLLLHRFLDPVRKPADRGAQMSRLVLPPLKPGAKLVARTTPGPSKDGSWDWIYLGRVSPVRSPTYLPTQFPRFNRVPDVADADLTYLFEEKGERYLLLHAPTVLSYSLNGNETLLRFEYGFREGAYLNGGQTDGATFKVELFSAGGAPRILFEKRLTPTTTDADRGSQTMQVAIPTGNAGTKLGIRIDTGPSGAWDWTYITNFELR